MANRLAKIPFADPAQVGYISWLEGRVEKQATNLRNMRVKQDEMIISINNLKQIIDGMTRHGKQFKDLGPIEPLGEGLDG